MNTKDNPRRPGDASLRLGCDVLARLDDYRRELEQRTPGVSVSRSAAARAVLLQALPAAGGAAGGKE